MARHVKAVRPKDPEALGLAVIALRRLVDGRPGGETEQRLVDALRRANIQVGVAHRMLENFDKISLSTRERFIGPLVRVDAVAPAVAPRVAPAAGEVLVPLPAVLLPGGLGPAAVDLGDMEVAPLPQPPAFPPAQTYSILYQGMHCVDETGPDVWRSDNVYVITSAVNIRRDGTNVLTTLRHPIRDGEPGIYKGVDSGNTFPGPVASCWTANVADTVEAMSLTTVVFEHDWGDPDHFRDEVEAAVTLALGLASYLFPAASPIFALVLASGLVVDFFNWLLGTGDDEIGTTTTVNRLADLEHFSRVPPSDFRGKGLPYDFVAGVNDNDYFAAYTVERDPPAPPYPPPVVERR